MVAEGGQHRPTAALQIITEVRLGRRDFMNEQEIRYFKLVNPFVLANWPGWSVDTNFTLHGESDHFDLLCRCDRAERKAPLSRERALREVASGKLTEETKRAFADALGTDDTGPRQVDRF